MAKWQKGQSGNLSGRPKSSLESRLACRALNDETLKVLTKLLRSDDEEMQFKAACRIRDEANGKPAQVVHVEEDEFANMTEAQIIAEVERELEQAKASAKEGKPS